MRHVSLFTRHATQFLTRTDGGRLATASGQKSPSSRSSCSKSFCTQYHFSHLSKECSRTAMHIRVSPLDVRGQGNDQTVLGAPSAAIKSRLHARCTRRTRDLAAIMVDFAQRSPSRSPVARLG